MPHSFETDVQPYGPGSIIVLKSPALQVSLSTLGATIHSVRVNPHFRPASLHATNKINVHDHPHHEVGAAAVEDTSDWTEVNMQYNNYEEALADCGTYFGATVGRYAGRIGNGTFTLNKKVYHTPKNQAGENTIHGGGNAFDKKQWQYKVLNSTTHPHPHAHHPVTPAAGAKAKTKAKAKAHTRRADEDESSDDEDEAIDSRHYLRATFHYLSAHNENGFPGELLCTVTYTIYQKQPHALCIDFSAVLTPKSPANATIVNMFNHAYWNLNGFPGRPPTAYHAHVARQAATADRPWPQAEPIHNHHLRLPTADTVAETDGQAIPSGKLVSVAGSPLDFRGAGHALGEGIDNKAALLRDPSGYDHPFFMNDYKMPNHQHSRHPQKKMSLNAVMRSPSTGIEMSVFSTFPCMWVYTANNLKEDAKGTAGERFARYRACCLEPQHLPDAINHLKTFPRTSFVVTKKSPYAERIVNVFTVQPHAAAPAPAQKQEQQKFTEGKKEAAKVTSLLPKYLSKL